MGVIYKPVPVDVLLVVHNYADGVSAKELVEVLVKKGFDRRPTQRRVQALIDRGQIVLGESLRLFPGKDLK